MPLRHAIFTLCLLLLGALMAGCGQEEAAAKAADQVMAQIKTGNYQALENTRVQGLDLGFGFFGVAIGHMLNKSMQDGTVYKREKIIVGKDNKEAKVYYRGEDNFGKKDKSFTVLLMRKQQDGHWTLSGISLEDSNTGATSQSSS